MELYEKYIQDYKLAINNYKNSFGILEGETHCYFTSKYFDIDELNRELFDIGNPINQINLLEYLLFELNDDIQSFEIHLETDKNEKLNKSALEGGYITKEKIKENLEYHEWALSESKEIEKILENEINEIKEKMKIFSPNENKLRVQEEINEKVSEKGANKNDKKSIGINKMKNDWELYNTFNFDIIKIDNHLKNVINDLDLKLEYLKWLLRKAEEKMKEVSNNFKPIKKLNPEQKEKLQLAKYTHNSIVNYANEKLKIYESQKQELYTNDSKFPNFNFSINQLKEYFLDLPENQQIDYLNNLLEQYKKHLLEKFKDSIPPIPEKGKPYKSDLQIIKESPFYKEISRWIKEYPAISWHFDNYRDALDGLKKHAKRYIKQPIENIGGKDMKQFEVFHFNVKEITNYMSEINDFEELENYKDFMINQCTIKDGEVKLSASDPFSNYYGSEKQFEILINQINTHFDYLKKYKFDTKNKSEMKKDIKTKKLNKFQWNGTEESILRIVECLIMAGFIDNADGFKRSAILRDTFKNKEGQDFSNTQLNTKSKQLGTKIYELIKLNNEDYSKFMKLLESLQKIIPHNKKD